MALRAMKRPQVIARKALSTRDMTDAEHARLGQLMIPRSPNRTTNMATRISDHSQAAMPWANHRSAFQASKRQCGWSWRETSRAPRQGR